MIFETSKGENDAISQTRVFRKIVLRGLCGCSINASTLYQYTGINAPSWAALMTES
jgi:hypothetical protein